MRIIEGKTMTCNLCSTQFEYDDSEITRVPGYPCLGAMSCPRCHSQIIMVADEFREADKRIFVEENKDEEKTE